MLRYQENRDTSGILKNNFKIIRLDSEKKDEKNKISKKI